MALTFPTNPTPGQEHTDGGSTWVWDGISWNLKPAAAGGVSEVTGVAPVVVANGTTAPAVSVTVGTAAGTVAAGNHSHPSVLTSDAPQAVKVAGATGTAPTAARADHVHPGAVLLDPVSGALQTIVGPLTVAGAVVADSTITLASVNGGLIIGTKAAGQTGAAVFLREAGTAAPSNRWSVQKSNDAETGGNTGSSFRINRYSDAGGYVDAPLVINRSSGIVTIKTVLAAKDGLVDAVASAIQMEVSTDPETGETVETPMLDVAGAVVALGRELRAALDAVEALRAEVAALKGA